MKQLVIPVLIIIFTVSLILSLSQLKKDFKSLDQRVLNKSQPLKISTASSSAFLVSRVIDGDTIELSSGEKVRYIGMDTPETVDPRKPIQCFGKEASLENKKLVEGKTVTLTKDVSDKDKYGRLLRYVYVGKIFVNDYLVRYGFAHVATFPPDVIFAEQFKQAEQEARINNRGLWKNCPVKSPSSN
ncbi:MAG: thermonuclease family protein [Patescibacteria group bacterium]|nr:thermonuclease family protein [Patescibacteria group bacterium]